VGVCWQQHFLEDCGVSLHIPTVTDISFKNFISLASFCPTWDPSKLRQMEMILHYFERLRGENDEFLEENITFFRRVLTEKVDWASSQVPVTKLTAFANGKIEDDREVAMYVNFANEAIGGGVLRGGSAQEEIMFSIYPECLLSLLFCAKMNDNETIIITGARRYTTYRGFIKNPTFHDFREKEGSILPSIVCMDASSGTGRLSQWDKSTILRDLNKAYCAFRQISEEEIEDEEDLKIEEGSVSTGNWGCGAFGGDKGLKAIQQMMAASQAGRNLHYYTFRERYMGEPLDKLLSDLDDHVQQHNLTVSDLWNLISTTSTNENILKKIV